MRFLLQCQEAPESRQKHFEKSCANYCGRRTHCWILVLLLAKSRDGHQKRPTLPQGPIPLVCDKESPLHPESPRLSQEAQRSHGQPDRTLHLEGTGLPPVQLCCVAATGLSSPDLSLPSVARQGECAGCLQGAAAPAPPPTTRQSRSGLQNLLSFEPSARPHRVERMGKGWGRHPPTSFQALALEFHDPRCMTPLGVPDPSPWPWRPHAA